MVRSTPSNWWRDTARTLVFFFAGFFLIWASTFIGHLAFRWLWIDLESVVVPHHAPGEDPDLEAWRIIRSQFEGRWTVTVRKAVTHEFVCLTPGPSEDPRITLQYSTGANAVNPVVMPLSDWLRDKGALETCEERGFGAGAFYLNTCHTVVVAVVWPVTRCVESNVFVRELDAVPDA